MRIDGKQASKYSTEQIIKMLWLGAALDSRKLLTTGEYNELKKVLYYRKDGK